MASLDYERRRRIQSPTLRVATWLLLVVFYGGVLLLALTLATGYVIERLL